MVLPTFRSLAARRRQQQQNEEEAASSGSVVQGEGVAASGESKRTVTPTYTPGFDIKRATRARKSWIIISCLCFFIAVIFLILTAIGNISKKPVIRSTWFFKLDLSNIIPASTPSDIILVNSLARSLGLHDFYQIGLWSFCEGYNDEGVTDCSKPVGLYWFNPVEILLNELLSGATIALPAQINTILNLIKLASHFMFGFFLTGLCMNCVSVFVAPITLYSRWWELPFTLWTFISALLTTAGAVIATVMFVIFRNVITSQTSLNIGATLGTQMFGFMWVGAAFSIFAFVIHLCLSCCCASRRDVKTGRRRGAKAAYGENALDEKKRTKVSGRSAFRMPGFVKRKTSGEVV